MPLGALRPVVGAPHPGVQERTRQYDDRRKASCFRRLLCGLRRNVPAASTLEDLRIAELVKADVRLEENKIVEYRVKLAVSFKHRPEL